MAETKILKSKKDRQTQILEMYNMLTTLSMILQKMGEKGMAVEGIALASIVLAAFVRCSSDFVSSVAHVPVKD